MRLTMENRRLLYNEGDQRRDADPERFREWAKRYEAALASGADGELFELGKEIFAWLNENNWLDDELGQTGPLVMEFRAPLKPDADQQAFLHLPWELLANDQGFLAEDRLRLFVPIRVLGKRERATAPKYKDLHMVFMAAAPRGASELDFEAEEAGIIQATRRLPLALTVEESGTLEFLAEAIRALPDLPEVLHLSCHGDIVGQTPVLWLEDVAGDKMAVNSGEIAGALGESMPRLLFLSACRTAEGRANTTSLAMEMTRAGCPNVLGWDGSVYDQDAIAFARHFYRELAGHGSVEHAAAQARRTLLAQWRQDPRQSRHWHLARVTFGPTGGGQLSASSGSARSLPRDPGGKEFLDKGRTSVPVAPRELFVGRRRVIQTIIAGFRNGKPGVVIHGMGNVGKSSLAARLANRLGHLQSVVIFKDYDALAIFDAILATIPPQKRSELREAWRERVKQDPQVFGDALGELLAPASGQKPLLLIIDDLEQILEKPDGNRPRTPVRANWQPVLRAVMEAMRHTDSEARLIFTSRYRFSLRSARGEELVDDLMDLPLSPLLERERQKQWEAEHRFSGKWIADTPEKLHKRILDAAKGNPGLQNLLTRPLLQGLRAEAENALAQVENFRTSGLIPHGADAGEFFQRVALETYRNALTEDQRKGLSSLTLFQVPIPETAALAVLTASSVADPREQLSRLLGLGLLNRYEEVQGPLPHLAVESLVIPLLPALPEDRHPPLAQVAVPELLTAWREKDGRLPWNPLTLEIYRLARIAGHAAAMAEACKDAGYWLLRRQHDARRPLEMVRETLHALDQARLDPAPALLRLGAECAAGLGDQTSRAAWLERGLALAHADPAEMAQLWADYADLQQQRGNPEDALQWLRKAEAVFLEQGDIRSRAVTMGRIADILQARGDLDGALRIRREESLPVYERLGDIRARAVTMG
ncbi:MAG: CHAT domain-containing protein, partial [Magnetococcales bacterium]|nr:CHAT domain-containing protein [Magnetococcales bacterium]